MKISKWSQIELKKKVNKTLYFKYKKNGKGIKLKKLLQKVSNNLTKSVEKDYVLNKELRYTVWQKPILVESNIKLWEIKKIPLKWYEVEYILLSKQNKNAKRKTTSKKGN